MCELHIPRGWPTGWPSPPHTGTAKEARILYALRPKNHRASVRGAHSFSIHVMSTPSVWIPAPTPIPRPEELHAAFKTFFSSLMHFLPLFGGRQPAHRRPSCSPDLTTPCRSSCPLEALMPIDRTIDPCGGTDTPSSRSSRGTSFSSFEQ